MCEDITFPHPSDAVGNNRRKMWTYSVLHLLWTYSVLHLLYLVNNRVFAMCENLLNPHRLVKKEIQKFKKINCLNCDSELHYLCCVYISGLSVQLVHESTLYFYCRCYQLPLMVRVHSTQTASLQNLCCRQLQRKSSETGSLPGELILQLDIKLIEKTFLWFLDWHLRCLCFGANVRIKNKFKCWTNWKKYTCCPMVFEFFRLLWMYVIQLVQNLNKNQQYVHAAQYHILEGFNETFSNMTFPL